jgi:hypothetical protein
MTDVRIIERCCRGTVQLALCVLLTGCADQPRAAPTERSWLDADGDDPGATLARHLRGLDVAMIEIDHRYAELYFAGLDGNWPYAAYQLVKLRLVMELAVERRPARAAAAQAFFYPVLYGLEDAVRLEDSDAFAVRFQDFARACVSCHEAEQVASFGVEIPRDRRSSIVGR